MTLKEQLLSDLKAAMKSKDKIRKNTITMIRSAILQTEKDQKVSLEDSDILGIMAKQLKQRKDSLEDFIRADRKDLIDQANAEIAVIEAYLPKQLTKSEIEAIVDETLQHIDVTDIKDMGKAMQSIMPKVKGLADGKIVNQIVREKLKN